MADKVMRLKVDRVEHETRGGDVVLKVTGSAGGKQIRVEMALTPWAVRTAVAELRKGAKYHQDVWAGTIGLIGEPKQ